MSDITEQHNAQLEIKTRSEKDGMTGLLNRITAEGLIREQLQKNDSPGILILLDLDDLKGINDTFGHVEGDRAIQGIAQTLKAHFRESDIIGRIGGDEFVIFLPGAADSREAIAASLSNLLRKVTVIPIGNNNQRRVHCSIGCAVQTKDADTFEALYKLADVALYHVKRNSKNNYAFYSPEMEQSNFSFQAQRLFSIQSEKKFEIEELQHLLDAISEFYQLVLSMNLSHNDYFLMAEIQSGVFSKLPTYGTMDGFVDLTAKRIHPNDVNGFLAQLSRESLLTAYEQGKPSVHHYFRFHDGEDYQWTEAIAIFYTNGDGDVCDFTFVRWATERTDELDRLWMQRILDLAVISNFEYICLLDVQSGSVFLCSDRENSHNVPKEGNFEQITCSIRDEMIPEEERADYYEKANLNTILSHMKQGGDSYTYQYTMPDGPRTASFHWFDHTQQQLLMMVRRSDRSSAG